MEHDEAIAQHATERYLLNEMPEGERDAFEDHFFECLHCAADVRDGARMMAAGREVAREGATVHAIRPKRAWSAWIPQAAAASVIGATLGWFGAVQTVVPRVAATAPVIADYELDLQNEERGPEDAAKTIGTNDEVNAYFYVTPPDPAATHYVASIRNEAGKSLATKTVSLKQAEDRVTVLLPELPAGEYRVVIESVRQGGNRFPVTSIPFRVVEQREKGSPTRRQP